MPCKYLAEIITHIFHPTNHDDYNVLGKRVSECWEHCGYINPLSPGSGEQAGRHQGGNNQHGWAVRDAARALCQPSLWSWSLPLLSTARRLPRVSLPQRWWWQAQLSAVLCCQLTLAAGFVRVSVRYLWKQEQPQTWIRLSCSTDRSKDIALVPIFAILNLSSSLVLLWVLHMWHSLSRGTLEWRLLLIARAQWHNDQQVYLYWEV